MNNFTDNWIDSHKDELISAVQNSVSFPSVKGEPAPDAPFGKDCRAALAHALELCSSFGFDAHSMEGYIGYADHGKGSETLGILTHLDIVPAGEGWIHAPFGGEIENGLLYGRGTLDDKGPAMASIFALAAVKAAGYEFRRKVRLLFGCDEECGMGCMNHYEKHAPLPDISFSPDASYPLVHAEKNIFHAQYENHFASELHAQAGTVVNAVPGKAVATLPLAKEVVEAAAANMNEITVSDAASGCTVTYTGVAAHASTPEKGQNAIQGLLGFLAILPLSAEDAAAVRGLNELFAMDYYGENFGLDCEDDSGRLTLNLGLMNWDEKGYAIDIDIRAPISTGYDKLISALDASFAKLGAVRTSDSYSPGYCVPEDSELVSKLLDVYAARMGERPHAIKIGGGTYARHLKNAVAFGPERDDRDNRMHMTDENMPVDDLIENAKLTADAIIALACK